MNTKRKAFALSFPHVSLKGESLGLSHGSATPRRLGNHTSQYSRTLDHENQCLGIALERTWLMLLCRPAPAALLPFNIAVPRMLIQLTRKGTSEVDAKGENRKTVRLTCSSEEGRYGDATRGRASWTLMLRVSHGERFRTHLSFPGRMCKRGFISDAVDISRAASHWTASEASDHA